MITYFEDGQEDKFRCTVWNKSACSQIYNVKDAYCSKNVKTHICDFSPNNVNLFCIV